MASASSVRNAVCTSSSGREVEAATAAVASRSPDEFATLIAAEGQRWGALAQRAGAVAE